MQKLTLKMLNIKIIQFSFPASKTFQVIRLSLVLKFRSGYGNFEVIKNNDFHILSIKANNQKNKKFNYGK